MIIKQNGQITTLGDDYCLEDIQDGAVCTYGGVVVSAPSSQCWVTSDGQLVLHNQPAKTMRVFEKLRMAAKMNKLVNGIRVWPHDEKSWLLFIPPAKPSAICAKQI